MQNSSAADLKRIFQSLASGTSSDDDDDPQEASKLHSKMAQIYAVTRVCESNDNQTCYPLSPDLERTMQMEKDYDRLIWAWKGWHDGCGNQIRPVYLQYVDLLTKNIQKNGYSDLSVSKDMID